MIVYDGSIIIGHGYFVVLSDGQMLPPLLFDWFGNELPRGWYSLQMLNEEISVVIPTRIQ